ncbi:hypothetical protein SDC9_128754 [bioreactor metagenome]|uniref:Uncharacterized protein n=1 Tax=bioreactor metagenome TaxID=1076179 RepID=A0A645CXS5_9ZZZZ
MLQLSTGNVGFLVGGLCVMCVPLNLSRCLSDGGGQLLNRAGLLGGTLRERLCAVRHLLCATMDLLSGLVDPQNRGIQILQQRRHVVL